MIASSVWADRVAKYVRDVAVPCGFARAWWELCAFHWNPWNRETCRCKRGVLLVSGIVGGFV